MALLQQVVLQGEDRSAGARRYTEFVVDPVYVAFS